ncbi:MAG: hypothetical protein MJE68_33200 [Proteobacteria bacterium]|nr:hypothetical protein [Pseudomonadota bacterium]
MSEEFKFEKWSPWVKWHAHKEMRDVIRNPGVYVLAHFEDHQPIPLTGKFWLAKQICYIGETKEIARRFRNFRRAVTNINRPPKHSGGKTYRKKYRGEIRPDLYVTISHIDIGDKHISRSSHRNYDGVLGEAMKQRVVEKEGELLCDYIAKHDKLPCCNTKWPTAC